MARAAEAGVEAMIVPGWERESSVRATALAAAYPAIFPAVGLHPWFVREGPDTAWLRALLDDPGLAAIGEIGIDLGGADADLAQQDALFRYQLGLAAERDLPVLLHCRRGWDHLFAALDEIPVRGVVHAFSASLEVLRECLSRGLYVSFAGLVTRPNARRAREAAHAVPADRLLLETDAPNMAMHDIPAEDTEPAHLPRILAAVAALRQEDPDALAAQINTNVRALFRQ